MAAATRAADFMAAVASTAAVDSMVEDFTADSTVVDTANLHCSALSAQRLAAVSCRPFFFALFSLCVVSRPPAAPMDTFLFFSAPSAAARCTSRPDSC
jgi:hypothetical protein